MIFLILKKINYLWNINSNFINQYQFNSNVVVDVALYVSI